MTTSTFNQETPGMASPGRRSRWVRRAVVGSVVAVGVAGGILAAGPATSAPMTANQSTATAAFFFPPIDQFLHFGDYFDKLHHRHSVLA